MTVSASQQQQQEVEATVSPWRGFRPGLWQRELNVRDFIQQNYTHYDGDELFLQSSTARTRPETWILNDKSSSASRRTQRANT